jgi:hypothetical protein
MTADRPIDGPTSIFRRIHPGVPCTAARNVIYLLDSIPGLPGSTLNYCSDVEVRLMVVIWVRKRPCITFSGCSRPIPLCWKSGNHLQPTLLVCMQQFIGYHYTSCSVLEGSYGSHGPLQSLHARHSLGSCQVLVLLRLEQY